MTTHIQTFSFSRPSPSESDSLLIAIFLAAIVHAFVFLGISFSPPQPQKVNKQIEITLANSPVKIAPKKASFLAQENQLGAGEETNRPEPPEQKLPSQGESPNKPPAQQQIKTQNRPRTKQKLITQLKARQKISTSRKQPPASEKKRPQLSMEALQKQISQLGTKIRNSPQSSETTKFKYAHKVSTHKYLASQYILDLTNKIKRIARNNVFKGANKTWSSGSLTMELGINPDGSIYGMKITRRSGNKALDDLAKRIARRAAPYASVPRELLDDDGVLLIVRTWKFSNNTLADTH